MAAKATTSSRRRPDGVKPSSRRSSAEGVRAALKHDRDQQRPPRLLRELRDCVDPMAIYGLELSVYETFGRRPSSRPVRSTRNPDPDYVGKWCVTATVDSFIELKRQLVQRSCASKRRTKCDAQSSIPARLTRVMQREVQTAMVPTPPDEVLVSAFRIEIKRRDLYTLADGQWLNDEVVNFYLNLIAARSTERDDLPSVYAFSTFFLEKLMVCGYGGVSRWTRAVDIFAFDILLVPLHMTCHWGLLVVDFRQRRIVYYDSLGPSKSPVSPTMMIKMYLNDESRLKRDCELDWNDWRSEIAKVPLQTNSDDCGAFLCQYAECLTRDAPITFGPELVPYIRRRIAYEVLHKTILA